MTEQSEILEGNYCCVCDNTFWTYDEDHDVYVCTHCKQTESSATWCGL